MSAPIVLIEPGFGPRSCPRARMVGASEALGTLPYSRLNHGKWGVAYAACWRPESRGALLDRAR